MARARASSRTALALALGLLLTLPAHPAQAEEEWSAYVTRVVDGDTFDARVSGVGEQRIRMTGVQAMEIGWCNGSAATQRLEDLIEGKWVTLKARYASSENRDRPLRWVYRDGVDVGETLLKEGLAFAAPHSVERDNTAKYLAASQTAQVNHVGPLWDEDRCGVGPLQERRFKFWAEWDADGDDRKNLNDEYFRIWNLSSSDFPLKGWRVRDSGLTIYRFPDHAKIRPWSTVTVHVGSGTDTRARFYMRSSRPVLSNSGDAAVLMDPHGDIRAAQMYRCTAYCSDPLQGALHVWARRTASTPNGQYVKITNVSDRKINLNGYVLRNYPYGYDFGHRRGVSSTLYPGEVMRVYIGKGRESRLKRYWGKSVRILDRSSDRVEIETFDDVRVACKAWGARRC